MMAIVQDSKMRYVMMWLVCIISLALCLHFNEHATENRFQEHAYVDVIHTHHHEVNQQHSHHHHEVNQQHSHHHQDTYYEHFSNVASLKEIALILLLLGAQIFDRTQKYALLLASRIFKPPKKIMSFLNHFLIFGV